MKYYTVFAQAYGEGNYGNCTYNANDTQCSANAGGAAGTGNSGTGGGLANTGVGLVALLTIACAIVFVSLVVRIWRRKPVQVVDTIQEVEPEEAKRLSGRY